MWTIPGGRTARPNASLSFNNFQRRHSYFLNAAATVFKSFSAVYGFGRKVFTPSCATSDTLFGLQPAGRDDLHLRSSLRSARIVAGPSIYGIIISVITNFTSLLCAAKTAIASAPSPATTTR